MSLDAQDARFVRRVLIVAALAGLAFLLFKIAGVLVLAFGAVLAAIILRAVAAPVRRLTRLGETASIVIAVALLFLAIGLSLWLFGREVEAQLADLPGTLAAAWARVQARLSHDLLGQRLLVELNALDGRAGWLLARAPRWASDAVSAIASFVIVMFAGVFIALKPGPYVRGALRLLPVSTRPRAEAALEACGVALRQWLIAQAGSMVLMTVSIGTLLWAAGVGTPVALGLLAGLGQLVPLVGPFVAAAPAVLLALADGPEKAGWTVLIYLVVGQVESNLFSPLMLRQTAKLPMAVTLFTVFAFGVLLGPAGVLFATPLAVVIYVLVKVLYVEGLLEAEASDRAVKPSSAAAPP